MTNLEEIDKTSGRFFVQARIWDVKEGKIQKVKIDDIVFSVHVESDPHKEKINMLMDMNLQKYLNMPVPKKKSKHNVKISYLQKWIRQKDHGVVFTLDQFIKEFPKQKHNKRLSFNVSKLINENKIRQLSNKKFQVL